MSARSLTHDARAVLLVALLTVQLAPIVASAQERRADRLTFVVLGHLRGNSDGKPNYMLDEVVEEVRRQKPDVVVLAGDLIWGAYNSSTSDRDAIVREWEELDAKLATLGVPVHRVPGNHDISDPVTRDVYVERYGRPPQAVDVGDARFLLLSSTNIPRGDSQPPNPRPFTRGVPIDSAQLEFVRGQLADPSAPPHVFIVLHHMLWWEEDSPWWRDVHPLLVGRNVRAVFAGDYGPMKFSHVRRDGIDYVQTSIEGDVSVEMLRAFESSRLLSRQFDNYVVGTIDGGRVSLDVQTVGALATERFTPERWRAVHRYPDSRSLPEKAWALIGTPKRLAAVAVLLGGALGAGFLLGALFGRRRRQPA